MLHKRRPSRAWRLCLGLLPIILPLPAQEWPHYGADSGGTKFSSLKQITTGNVGALKVAWTYHTGDVSDGTDDPIRSAFESTPLAIDGVLYFTTPFCRVIALEAETGKEIWTFDPKLDRTRTYPQYANRGVAYWRHGSAKRIFVGTLDGRLIALDARTGGKVINFGDQGTVYLRKGTADDYPEETLYGMTSPPLVYKNLVIAGTVSSDGEPQGPSGDVRAFDARTGKPAWRFHVIPQPGETGNETWAKNAWKGRGGANAWAPLSCDEGRGVVYLPLGSPSYDPIGTDRKGQNLFGDALVALDAATGKRLWHFQTIHHDLWDWDLPAQPTLVDLPNSGKTVPGVAQVTKTGFVFVFNRLNGRAWFGVEERPVPPSPIPEEEAWPTQPFPLRPPPISRQSMNADELTDVTPESRAECAGILAQASVVGKFFQPWGLAYTLNFPWGNGGANLGGAAYDREANQLFVNTMDVGVIARLEKAPPESKLPYRFRGAPKTVFWDSRHYPCQKPPWGRLTAVDLNDGTIRWQVPLGIYEELVASGIPPTGTPNIGGPIVTAGGLVFIGASNDRRIRAFDKQTGRELWSALLPASGHATPMTFLGRRTGRQYVVIAAGGGNRYSDTFSDALVAFALP